MAKPVSSVKAVSPGETEMKQGEGCASSPFAPYEHGWLPVRLAELASNGFPFSPTFLLPRLQSEATERVAALQPALPFGFHYCRPTAVLNRPVIDLTRGEYDPHTQTYTIALCAGGDTDGGHN
jgi:hypothetical protein